MSEYYRYNKNFFWRNIFPNIIKITKRNIGEMSGRRATDTSAYCAKLMEYKICKDDARNIGRISIPILLKSQGEILDLAE